MSDDRVALVTGAKARLLVGSLSIVTKRRDECPVVSNCKDGEMVKEWNDPHVFRSRYRRLAKPERYAHFETVGMEGMIGLVGKSRGMEP
jgi:hypothetical protein